MERITVTTGAGKIGHEVMNDILTHYLNEHPQLSTVLESIQGMNLSWLDGKGVPLSTRINKKLTSLKLDNDLKSRIINHISKVFKNSIYEVSFHDLDIMDTTIIHDGDSCFRSSRRDHRRFLKELGALYVIIEQNKKPISRCILLPFPNGCAIFNVYGELSLYYHRYLFAQIASKYLKIENIKFKKMEFYSAFYINNNTIIVCYDPIYIENADKCLKIISELSAPCVRCGTDIPISLAIDDTDHSICCPECVNLAKCPKCEHHTSVNDFRYVIDENGTEASWCMVCVEDYTKLCPVCQCYVVSHNIDKETGVCMTCRQKHSCEHCGKFIYNQEVRHLWRNKYSVVPDAIWCVECAEEYGAMCERCISHTFPDNIVYVTYLNKTVCLHCSMKL